MNKRLSTLRAAMTAQNIDLVVLGPGAHLAWLLNVRPHADERPLLLCITQSYAGFLMPSLEADSASQQTNLPFHRWSDDEGPEQAFAELLKTAGVTAALSIALDETMRADFAGLVQDALPTATRQFAASTVGALRMPKDTEEYAVLKINALTADVAMQAAWATMKVGMSETDVAAVVRDSFKSQDVQPIFNIVGAGRNGAFPHHHTGNTLLNHGDAVVMDIGGSKNGYSSDMTRMAVMGGPPEGYEEIHAIVESAVQAALIAAKPGVKAHVVDDAARGVITQAGYGEYFVHRTGHGMGVEVHEPPYITASSQSVLEEGMVFSIEPGIYLPERFGIRLEDIVIMRADGPEIFSELPRDVHVVDD